MELIYFSTQYIYWEIYEITYSIQEDLFSFQFNFDEFYDSVNLDAGEITWKLLHDVCDKDENLPGNLKKAYKLT